MTLKKITSQETLASIQDFENRGGVLLFQLYQSKDHDEPGPFSHSYQNHLLVAQQTLETAQGETQAHFDDNEEDTRPSAAHRMTIDMEALHGSGKKMEVRHFLGPYYDLEQDKPLVRGLQANDTMNSYFFYDEAETPDNIVDLSERREGFDWEAAGAGPGFVYAFMEPPYTLEAGETILERGKYLMGFMDHYFGKKEGLEVFSWSTDCAPFFDAGKEWWGTFFWTVYCPEKDWYIGILGSSTD